MQNKLWLFLGCTILSTSLFGVVGIDDFRKSYIAPSGMVNRSELIAEFNRLSPLNQRLANAMLINRFKKNITQLRQEELAAIRAGRAPVFSRRAPRVAPKQVLPVQPSVKAERPDKQERKQKQKHHQDKHDKRKARIAALQKAAARKATLAKKRAAARKKAHAYKAKQKAQLRKAKATACKIARQLRQAQKAREAQEKAARIKAAQALAAQQAKQLEAARKAQEAQQAQLRAEREAANQAVVIKLREQVKEASVHLAQEVSKKDAIKKDLEQSLLDVRARLAVGPQPDVVHITNDITNAQARYAQYQQAVAATEKSASDFNFSAQLIIQNQHVPRNEKERAVQQSAHALKGAQESRHDRDAKAQELKRVQKEFEKVKTRIGQDEALRAEVEGLMHMAENVRKDVQTALAGMNALSIADLDTRLKKLDTTKKELVSALGKALENVEKVKPAQEVNLRNALETARKEIAALDLSPLAKRIDVLKAQQAELEKKAVEEAKQVVEAVSRKVTDLAERYNQFREAKGKLIGLMSGAHVTHDKLEEAITEYKKHVGPITARLEDLDKDNAVIKLRAIEPHSELLDKIEQVKLAIQPGQTEALIHRAELQAKAQLLKAQEVPPVPSRSAAPAVAPASSQGPVPPARVTPVTQPSQVVITLDAAAQNTPTFKAGNITLDAHKPEEFIQLIEKLDEGTVDALAKELITATDKADKDDTRLSALYKLMDIYGLAFQNKQEKVKEKMRRLMTPAFNAVTNTGDSRYIGIQGQIIL